MEKPVVYKVIPDGGSFSLTVSTYVEIYSDRVVWSGELNKTIYLNDWKDPAKITGEEFWSDESINHYQQTIVVAGEEVKVSHGTVGSLMSGKTGKQFVEHIEDNFDPLPSMGMQLFYSAIFLALVSFMFTIG